MARKVRSAGGLSRRRFAGANQALSSCWDPSSAADVSRSGLGDICRLLSDLDIVQIWTKRYWGGAVGLYGGRHGRACWGVRLVLVVTFTLTNQKQSLRCAPFRPIRGDPPGMGLQEPGYLTA
jgi:hypothetical protein